MSYIDDAVRVRAYCGAVGTGKTQQLVDECARLVAGGEDPQGILVFAASPAAAAALSMRLEGAGIADVCVTTPLTWAIQALSSDDAQAYTGREPHVLNDYEQDFFFEDMRVRGTKQHRLREILKFFYRGWSEMRDDEGDWLVTVEETDLNRMAKADLNMLRAYHPSEVSAACVRYLTAHPDALAQKRAVHVLADDFRAMSRASQRLCQMLATESLIVTWDEVASLVGEEAYGYEGGLEELQAGSRAFERVELEEFKGSSCAYEAVANLFKQECVDASAPRREGSCEAPADVRVANMLEDEPAGVVRTVREALEAGVAPDDVFVVAGRASWVSRVREALHGSGIPTTWVNDHASLGGDIRDAQKSVDAAMANAVRLAANTESCLAWRCWCGFGDYLCHSAAFSDLAHALDGTQAHLTDLLYGLAGANDVVVEGDMLDRDKIARRVSQGLAMLQEARGLKGIALLEVLRRHVCDGERRTPGFDALVGEVSDDDTACELLSRIDAAFSLRPPKQGCVRMGCPDDLLGQTPRVLVLCGLTNGLYPERGYFDLLERTIDDQAKMHERLVRQLIEVCGKAGERLVLSGFSNADILDAEPMKLMTERIRLRNRRRVCEFAPSAVIDYITGAKTAYVR